MKQFLISTDTTADLPKTFIEEHTLGMLSLNYRLDDVEYHLGKELPEKDFYAMMRSGKMPTTSQVNPQTAKECLLKMLEQSESKKLLHIAFSSGLSGSYNSARIAAEEIMDEYEDYQIRVVDSLCASLGEGLLVYYAVKFCEEGRSFEETVQWIEANKLHIVHNFTVDDLFHLHRGGRISKAAAIFGSMVNVKPLLHVDDEGHLVPVSKVRGRKKSLAGLVESMEAQIGSFREENEIVFISHGDCLEDAQYVQSLIEKKFDIHSFLINYVGPTIGAHSGPGTVALFYLGDRR